MNIVILGGGTAGWLAALYAERFLPHTSVSVIDSKEIGILGAGEGTTPHFLHMLKELDIPVEHIIKYAKGTFKSGIKFTGWNKENTSYFHPFKDVFSNHIRPYPVYKAILESKNLDSYLLSSVAGDNYKVTFRNRPDTNNINYDSKLGLSKFQPQGNHGLHFDARLLADMLGKTGRERGIKVIDNIIDNVTSDIDGYITFLNFCDGSNIETDFVFDCSGFSRLLIGKHFKTEWESYLDSIPNDRAIPFFIKNDTSQVPPYTESIAMNNGWVWKIPVQGRYGCGYVFSSKYTTEDDVKKEIKDKFGEVEFPNKIFSFNAGCFKTQWVKNCISLGLASGFIEPLEATSLWTVHESLNLIGKNLPGIINRNENYIKEFNDEIYRLNKEIVSFIYYHYITKKTNTTYWSEFRMNNIPPAGYIEFEERFASIFKTNSPLSNSFSYFATPSLLTVGVGIDFFNKNAVKEQYEVYISTHNESRAIKILHRDQQELSILSEQALDHYYLIESIKNES
jgi:tryptophan halogenase